jgi:hypothetical protein
MRILVFVLMSWNLCKCARIGTENESIMNSSRLSTVLERFLPEELRFCYILCMYNCMSECTCLSWLIHHSTEEK